MSRENTSSSVMVVRLERLAVSRRVPANQRTRLIEGRGEGQRELFARREDRLMRGWCS
jgi:hypothetical protein